MSEDDHALCEDCGCKLRPWAPYQSDNPDIADRWNDRHAKPRGCIRALRARLKAAEDFGRMTADQLSQLENIVYAARVAIAKLEER